MAAAAIRPRLRGLRRAASILALTTALVFGAGVGAYADPTWDGENTDGGTDVGGTDGGSNGNPGTGGNNGGGGAIRVPVPWTQKVFVPYCSDNSVRATGRGVGDYETVGDVLCTGFGSCPADDEYRYRVFERSMGPDNLATEDNFRSAGVVCRGRDEPNESEPPTITTEDIIERARALAPTPTFVIEPADRSYVNIPTNFAAEAEAARVTVELLGYSIPVEFTPGDVTWSFGDGSSGSGVGVRNASVGQSGAVEHAYARSGEFSVSVTVGYTARIFVPNGPPIDMPTPIDRTSAPQALEVGEIQSVVTEVD